MDIGEDAKQENLTRQLQYAALTLLLINIGLMMRRGLCEEHTGTGGRRFLESLVCIISGSPEALADIATVIIFGLSAVGLASIFKKARNQRTLAKVFIGAMILSLPSSCLSSLQGHAR